MDACASPEQPWLPQILGKSTEQIPLYVPLGAHYSVKGRKREIEQLRIYSRNPIIRPSVQFMSDNRGFTASDAAM
jgi:hypothetical protein